MVTGLHAAGPRRGPPGRWWRGSAAPARDPARQAADGGGLPAAAGWSWLRCGDFASYNSSNAGRARRRRLPVPDRALGVLSAGIGACPKRSSCSPPTGARSAFTEDDDGAPRAKRGGGGLVSALGSIHGSERAVGVRGAVRRRPAGRPRGAGRAARPGRARDRHRAGPDAADRPEHAGPGLQRDRQLDAVVRAPPALRHPDRADASTRRGGASGRPTSPTTRRSPPRWPRRPPTAARRWCRTTTSRWRPRLLRQRRPDLRIAHFSHTPWAPPDYFRVLPDDVGPRGARGHPRRRPRRLPLPAVGPRVHGLLRRGARRPRRPRRDDGRARGTYDARRRARPRGRRRRPARAAPTSPTSGPGSPRCATGSATGWSSPASTAPS